MRIILAGCGSISLRNWTRTQNDDGSLTITGWRIGDGITVPPPWTAPCPTPEGDDWPSVADGPLG